MRRPLVMGNWKMNGSAAFTRELLSELTAGWSETHAADVAVCTPYPYLALTADLLEKSDIAFGAQDVSIHESGAYTGEVSADMLKDCGCQYVLVGHSERREYHGESSELVAQKFKAAVEKGVTPVLCVGETLEERESEQTFAVIESQLKAVIDQCGFDVVAKGVIAYEPVWAIGTGKSATPEIAQDVHAFIREKLGSEAQKINILYGGSVKPETAEALFQKEDIDGALVGGASLKAQDFLAICKAAE